jgi:UDP-2-acetamido-3-amino-2,3-dideoxy-glucuronate N-acetyltransferase
VIGDRAMAVFDDGQPWSRKLLLYPHRIEWREAAPVPQRAEAHPVPLEEGEPLKLECQHFLDCIATGSRPRTDGPEGLRVLRVLAQATDALRGVPAPAPKARAYPSVHIHESAYVDQPCEIGSGTYIWHFAHVLPRTRIGRNCSLGQNVMVGPDVTIGDACRVQNNVSIYKGVTLEDAVFCGPSCVFTNVNNPRAEVGRKDEFRSTLVKRGATIGANATIVCGHTIGGYAFIAAGAVVTQDVPAFALVAGVPAQRIGWMSHAGERLEPDLVCPRSGRRYRENGPDRLEEIA